MDPIFFSIRHEICTAHTHRDKLVLHTSSEPTQNEPKILKMGTVVTVWDVLFVDLPSLPV